MNGVNLSRWAVGHRPVVVFFMLTALVAGILAYSRLGRNEDPAFTIRTMVVQAGWPGATLEETLLQVTERLERTLQETPHLDYVRSFTRPGMTTIFVELKGSTPAAAVPDAWYQVRKRVADIRLSLPVGIVGPLFNDDFGDTFGIIYGFTADGFTHRELRDYVEDARSKLLQVRDVSKIEVLGAQDEQIFVEASMEKLAGLGVDRAALITALQAQNIVVPSGTIQTGDEALSLRVSGAFRSERDIADVNFVAGGRILRLSDIAEVKRGYADPPQPMFRVNGKPAIGLAISMREGGDILALGRNIKRSMAAITGSLPIGVEPVLVADQPVTVDDAIAEFMTSLWQAVAIILIVSFISLGMRAGAVVALAIPLTLATVFPVMWMVGIDLQRISLGALIIALALLVDDAMTTVDATLRRLAEGDEAPQAATHAYRSLAFAMLAGTLVTIAGFVPVGFAQSAAGEYTFSIFAVVTIALLTSWLVALIFAPVLCTGLLSRGAAEQSPGPGIAVSIYRRALETAVDLGWLTILVAAGAFVLAAASLRFVPHQFFPPSDRVELLVDLRLPQNASIFATKNVAERFDRILAHDADVDRWSTYVGRGAIRFYLPLNVQLPNPFFAQAVIVAKSVAARERLQTRLESLLENQFPGLVGRVYPLELGPPVGWPVQYRIIGPDLGEVRDIALRLAQVLAQSPDLERINFDWMEPSREIRVRVDQDQARLLGLSSEALAAALNAAITGLPITQVRDGIYLIDVIVRSTDGRVTSPARLRTLQIALPSGRTVPLSQLATFEYTQDYPLVWRRDRVPTLTVQADVKPGALAEGVVAALDPKIAEMQAGLPAGYRVETGGVVEESNKSRASVFAVVPLMLFLMLTVLMMELKSFQRLLIVLSVVPLSLIGIVGALLLSGRPLGFVAILGVLALIGIIAKNAVILVGQIEQERTAGKSVRAAVVDASCSRFRPIVLTAISTILGMVPIAVTVFWGPMAVAVMGGLLVGTLLTLIFLPALYATWFGRIDGDGAGTSTKSVPVAGDDLALAASRSAR